MKKLLSLLFLLSCVVALQAQPCYPDVTYTAPGIYPDTVTNLPNAAVNQYYTGVITAVVPVDTVLYGMVATIDSIGVKNIAGLPSGFTWAANTTSAYFHGGDSGCVAIMGTPTTGMEGTYPITIYVESHGKLSGMPLTLPDTVKGFKIVILDSTNVGLIDSRQYPFAIKETYPNPASSNLVINVANSDAALINITIFDMLGQSVLSTNEKINAGENLIQLNVANIPEGIYFYTVRKGEQALTQKLIINR
ncbi:MAG: T9SS type A sorting domain-containing protein [Bacteroidales bacterium]|nr:T9SS type A sorting domain-containing protein [Bacteroidales bacterium]